ncbi:unnamed protein product, partial [Iphiclides podalirius]
MKSLSYGICAGGWQCNIHIITNKRARSRPWSPQPLIRSEITPRPKPDADCYSNKQFSRRRRLPRFAILRGRVSKCLTNCFIVDDCNMNSIYESGRRIILRHRG